MATADFTNDLVHYAQILQSNKLQDFNWPTKTSKFDGDFTTTTITIIEEVLQDAIDLSTFVDFSDCEYLFHRLQHHLPKDKLPDEEDEAKTKVVVEHFVRDKAIHMVERCIQSIDIAVQQHTYLRKVHEKTSDFVRKLGNTNPFDRDIYVGDRSSKAKASLTYFSIMLDLWAHETVGVCHFLVDVRKLLLEENKRAAEEKARVANDATARTGPFGKCKKALMKVLYEVAVLVTGA